MRFFQSGTMVWIGVKKGDLVKKGQVLAKLDDKLKKIDLEIDLANYRRTRAEFEEVARKFLENGGNTARMNTPMDQLPLLRKPPT